MAHRFPDKPTSNDSLETQIARFSDYFNDQIRFIGNLDDSLYTRILWVTLLDALSRAGSPQLQRKNKERIIRFVDTYCKWPYRDHVSLPQTILNLRAGQFIHGRLYKNVVERLKTWEAGSMYGPDDDLKFDSLLPLVYCECEKEILKKCRYKDLFYSYRNHLVHGFRPPGHAIEGSQNSKRPFYLSMQNDEDVVEWELVFPSHTFRNLCETGLLELSKVLIAEKRSPYNSFDFSSKW